MARDGFSPQTADGLAKRAASTCSNPDCAQVTSGPSSDPEKATNVGVAAHICAASPKGPRYDATMTSGERKSASNGVWLCQRCAKLIDNDEQRYPVALLRRWKTDHEAKIELQVRSGGRRGVPRKTISASEALPVLARLFDRPAFTTPFKEESDLPDFKQALTDTIEALNTGVRRLRDGTVLEPVPTRHDVDDPRVRDVLGAIESKIRKLRAEFDGFHTTGEVRPCGCGKPDCPVFMIDPAAAQAMDALRTEILDAYRSVYPGFQVQVGF